ncbi:MAG: HNH endonuclease signature motif containing protein [Bacillota bacterium]|nr:HNH endonuclease signature motif containing protein [Bacillota bacterium]
MGSLYLNQLSREAYQQLIETLHQSQLGKCFICRDTIDLSLHADSMDVDHIEPLKTGGKDDPSNFALTHAHCNRSKQASDLRIARVLARFERIQGECIADPSRPNLSDVFAVEGGSRYDLPIRVEGRSVAYSFPDADDHSIRSATLWRDSLSGMDYFFAALPISYLFHDDRINPRAIAANSLRKLLEEFHRGMPQLHVSLGWLELDSDGNKAKVKVFDGQHKAAAQVLLGVKELPIRVFVNPDLDVLLTANTNAGTTLRQVAFDKSVQRHLGSALYQERIEQFVRDRGLPEDYRSFAERDLVNHFRGQWREVRRYILDDVRDSVTHHPDNRLKAYVDFGGRGTERPLSYSSIEKTFYSFFIYQDVLDIALDYRLEEGENPRELEKEQILKLMNLVADEIYTGQFDPGIGTYRLERKVQEGEDVPPGHLRAFRMGREEILYNWLRYVGQVVKNYFLMQGRVIQEDRLFQYRFPEPLWDRVEAFLGNLKRLPVWMNRELSETVFGGKQTYDYWQAIFETARTPAGQQVLAAPLNLMDMITEPVA